MADLRRGLPEEVRDDLMNLAADSGMTKRSKFVQLADVDPLNFLGVLQRKAGRRPVREVFSDAGFDSIQYPFYGDSVVVFSPTQIKSAISNTGDFSLTDPDIRGSATLPTIGLSGGLGGLAAYLLRATQGDEK